MCDGICGLGSHSSRQVVVVAGLHCLFCVQEIHLKAEVKERQPREIHFLVCPLFLLCRTLHCSGVVRAKRNDRGVFGCLVFSEPEIPSPSKVKSVNGTGDTRQEVGELTEQEVSSDGLRQAKPSGRFPCQTDCGRSDFNRQTTLQRTQGPLALAFAF